ncbi:MAG: hypothetical protein IJI14_03835 [Anaerolineaceae bacterium]|nr:hypothetical protein [Anaerolineaceae bacterium]
MFYSKIIPEAAAIVAEKIGCSSERAEELIDNVVFNSDIDLNVFLKSIVC